MATRALRPSLALLACLLAGATQAASLDFWAGRHTVSGNWTALDGSLQSVTAGTSTARIAIEGRSQTWVEELMVGTRGGVNFMTWTRIAPDLGDGMYGYMRGDGRDGSVTLARGSATAADLEFTAVPLSRPDGGLERIRIENISGNNFSLVQQHSSDGGVTWQERGRLQYTAAAANAPQLFEPGLPICGSPLHLQLGVWAGVYDMSPPAGTVSSVAQRMGGCMYVETLDYGASAGGGLAMYDQRSGQLQRLFVGTDGVWYFHAGARTPHDQPNGQMVLVGGPDGSAVSKREVFEVSAGNITRMFEEVTADGGTTWTAGSFDRALNRQSSTVGQPGGGPHPGFNFGNNQGDVGNGEGGGGALAPLLLLSLGLLRLGLARRRRG